MAAVIPSDIDQLARSGAHRAELVTLKTLRDSLPAQYTVFHGVHWTRPGNARILYGEIDFIVLNPGGAMLIIEQKNGSLLQSGRRLIKRYGANDKDVFGQLQRAIGNLRTKFSGQNHGAKLEIDYLVYCPDHHVMGVNAAGLDIGRIVDAKARTALAERIVQLLPAGRSSPACAERIRAFLCERFDAVPDIHAHVDAQHTNFVRLTGGLVDVLDRIEMTPLRLRVSATAGNGKTHVARHFFNRAIEHGRNPLLLCFNRPLRERLKYTVNRGGLVETWYGFCRQVRDAFNQPLDFARGPADWSAFWREVVDSVQALAVNHTLESRWRFDTLIVDEAQDFDAEWYQTLHLFLGEDAEIVWLEDPNQNVRGAKPPELGEHRFVGYRSFVNFRSPVSIARVLQGAFPDRPMECANDLPGLGVKLTTYDDPADQPLLVGKAVNRLMGQGFSLNEIVILSCRGLKHSALADVERVANRTLARFTGDYDMHGEQLRTDGQILLDTVRRFKGQQSPAVILTDIEPGGERISEALMVAYCGMTRATVKLELLARRGNPWVAQYLSPAVSENA